MAEASTPYKDESGALPGISMGDAENPRQSQDAARVVQIARRYLAFNRLTRAAWDRHTEAEQAARARAAEASATFAEAEEAGAVEYAVFAGLRPMIDAIAENFPGAFLVKAAGGYFYVMPADQCEGSRDIVEIQPESVIDADAGIWPGRAKGGPS